MLTDKKMVEIDEAAGTYTTPPYAWDEKKDGFVCVIVQIEHLTTSKSWLPPWLPRSLKTASNAKVCVEFDDRALHLIVTGEKGEMKGKNYRLIIRKLRYEIVKDKSYSEIDKGRVLLYLCKKENKSWDPALNSGLDAADDEVHNARDTTVHVGNVNVMTVPVYNEKEINVPANSEREVIVPVDSEREIIVPVDNEREINIPMDN